MSIHVKIDAAEAEPLSAPSPRRRKFTSRDVQVMLRAGILREGENVELIDGELIEMASRSARHSDMRTELAELLSDNRPEGVRVSGEVSLFLSEHFEPEPDLVLFTGARVSAARGPTVLLFIEVAASSLSYDLEVRAPAMPPTACASAGSSMPSASSYTCIAIRGRMAMALSPRLPRTSFSRRCSFRRSLCASPTSASSR